MNPTQSLTSLYAGGENPNILGRDKETEDLLLTLLRYEKPNALLVGPPGVGKTSLIHHLAYLIANKHCPPLLYGYRIIEVNPNSLLAGPGYRGVTEQKFDELIQAALKKDGKVILFFDEFHTIENLGQMANGQTPGLGNTLKPYLTRPDFRVIGSTTQKEYSEMTDAALLRRFFKIEVGEPTDEAVLNIIKYCLMKYGESIKFGKTVPDTILKLSQSMEGYNPDKAKDICDLLCSFCRLKEIKIVSTDLVNDFFRDYFLRTLSKSKVQKHFENFVVLENED